MSDKTNKLNIFLVKEEYSDFDQIVRANANPHEIEGVGIFYAEDSFVRIPDWVRDFFGAALGTKFKIRTASSRGVLLVKIDRSRGKRRIFAVVFGHGRHLLQEGVIEERFGLKVVLNSVDRESLRSIDKTTLGSVSKQSREQLSRESEAANFGIDIEQDLVNAVTGRSNHSPLGKTISGRDALAVSVKIDLKSIREFLPIVLDQYESQAYKNDFDWIDQIKDVRDQKTLDKLTQWLLDKLNAGDLDRIWMAPPSVIDWVDLKGFHYAAAKNQTLHGDLDVKEFLATLKGRKIDVDLLKSKTIYAVSTKTDEAFDHWTVYKCLYAEARLNERVFVLNNGKWYEIAASFTKQVLDDFDSLPESSIALPNYGHADEGSYNDHLPTVVANSYSMDRKMISHGGGHSTIEFCDLLTKEKQIIHVKRYSGSAQLSHLFNQGIVSGELFLQEESFRTKVNAELPADHKLTNVAARPDPTQYEVVFAIISKSKNPLDIPFFSKVSLRNARRRLQAYGYKVTKKKIDTSTGN